MRLYLDFDGCMHRRAPNSMKFEYIDDFVRILRQYPNAQVFISSSWREDHSFDEMRSYFPEDVQHQIVGVTPALTGEWRYDEIMMHVRDTGYSGNYIVIDDDRKEFPEDWMPLLLCDPMLGFDSQKQEELQARLRHAARWQT